MPISSVCSKELICIEQSATLQQAAQAMRKYHIGGLVVLENGDKSKPVGILTDRDIALTVGNENRPFTIQVKDVMSSNLIKVSESEGIVEVIDKMKHEGVRRVVVTDEDGHASGLVSFDDLLQLLAGELSGLAQLVQRQLENEKIYRPEQRPA